MTRNVSWKGMSALYVDGMDMVLFRCAAVVR
jgi:hypothetical protein